MRDKEKIKEYNRKYKERNKEKIKEYNKKYKESNPNSKKKSDKKYYDKNKDILISRSKLQNSKPIRKEWKEKNKEHISLKNKEYKEKNKEKIKEYSKEYRIKNKDRLNENRRNRMNIDPIYKMSVYIRNLIKSSIKRLGYIKKSKSLQILGCSFEYLKGYLESKFETWMTWENYGLYNGELNYGWDIDHIIPVSSAKTEDDLIRLNHYINLQPLCSYTNRYIKSDNYL